MVENNGQRREMILSRAINSNYVARDKVVKDKVARDKTEVTIPINQNREYIASARINGFQIEVLVDTGANVVAMNSFQARRLSIDYKKGTPTQVVTPLVLNLLIAYFSIALRLEV